MAVLMVDQRAGRTARLTAGPKAQKMVGRWVHQKAYQKVAQMAAH